MKIDTLKYPDKHFIEERLWGRHLLDDKFDQSIPTCVGIQRTLPTYVGFLMPFKQSDKGTMTTGWPELMKYTKTFNLLYHMEVPCVHYKYKVKTNVIKPKTTVVVKDPAVTNQSIMGGEDISICVGEQKDDHSITLKRVTKLVAIQPSKNDYVNKVIEHCYAVTIPDHTPENSGHAQPSLHIGVLPIQTNAPEKEIQEYVTACATWEIKTRVVVSTDLHQHCL